MAAPIGTYLEDATNFEGLETLQQPMHLPNSMMCSKCDGHGGWNLRLDAYGPGVHFRAGCFQCSGWGWVTGADANCVHAWGPTRTVGHCLHEMQCGKCGHKRLVDSSD